jgi:hypothetical protein
MSEWLIEYRTGCGHWTPVGWWRLLRAASHFLRTQANPLLQFRITREAA